MRVYVMDGVVEECVDPGGHKRGGKRVVGIGQWKRLDLQNAGKLKGRAWHNTKTALSTEYVSYV